MAKKKQPKSGKGILIVIILTLLALAAGVASIVLLSHNRTLSQIFGGDSNVYDSAQLSDLSMNGEHIGDTISSVAKEHMVLDADFPYMYNGVAYWTDKNDMIKKLSFHTLTYADGEPVIDIEGADIQYRGSKLATVKDFEETFGIAVVTKDSTGAEIYTYTQSGYKLVLYVVAGKIQNVTLSKE